MEAELRVVDDSGLLGLVDASAYSTYVREDWTYEQLLSHFSRQMGRGTILVWDRADGGNNYCVQVRDKISSRDGYREAIGQVVVTGVGLHLASYTTLTMAAQFPEYRIPGKHEESLFVAMPTGSYKVRVLQTYDPNLAQEPLDGIHFVLELEPGTANYWSDVGWRRA
jgi:hypothetical protein